MPVSKRSTIGWSLYGARQALMGPAFMVGFSLFGVGGLARAAEFPMAAAAASTLLIWAGPAQVIFFVGAATKMAWPLIALSVSLSSVRMLPMGIALLPLLRGQRTGLWPQLLAAHLISITVWVEGMRRAPLMERETRLPFFLGFAAACILLTTGTTVLGYLLIDEVPVPIAAGFLFLSPIYFVASLARNASEKADWMAIGAGIGLLPLANWALGPGFDLMAAGLFGGTLAWYFGHRHKWRGRAA